MRIFLFCFMAMPARTMIECNYRTRRRVGEACTAFEGMRNPG